MDHENGLVGQADRPGFVREMLRQPIQSQLAMTPQRTPPDGQVMQRLTHWTDSEYDTKMMQVIMYHALSN